MKVLSFDCGHDSLGVCLVDINIKWKEQLTSFIEETYDKFTAIRELNRLNISDKASLIKYINNKIQELDAILSAVYKIEQVFSMQITDGDNVRKLGPISRASKTKLFLVNLWNAMYNAKWFPDVVLVEDQTINHLSSEIVGQVSFFFSPPVPSRHISLESYQNIRQTVHPNIVEDWLYASNTSNTSNIPNTTTMNEEVPQLNVEIIMVKPTLKNMIYFDETLRITHFYSKYINLYEANKSHTKANFLYFISVMDSKKHKDITCRKRVGKNRGKVTSKRQRDMADSFIQALAYTLFFK